MKRRYFVHRETGVAVMVTSAPGVFMDLVGKVCREVDAAEYGRVRAAQERAGCDAPNTIASVPPSPDSSRAGVDTERHPFAACPACDYYPHPERGCKCPPSPGSAGVDVQAAGQAGAR